VGIPLRDISRRPVHPPVVTVSIIIINALVFFLELTGGDAFVQRWSVIPADIVAGQNWVTILTSMFMHGGWMHIIGNMVFLWAFGPAIEDAMGHLRYLVFYLLGGVVAALAQIAAASTSTVPSLGASGAIAAVMGAFLITYPRDRIRTLLFLGWFIQVTVLPASLLIGIWFVIQLFSQVGSVVTTQSGQSGGVAYMAHIGGLIFGFVTARLFEDSRRIAAQTLE
jgi:membrane associated rhomboid family serine protease